MASLQGHTEIVRLLLQQPNIDVHKNPDGDSAIGRATQNNHTEIIQLLNCALENGSVHWMGYLMVHVKQIEYNQV